MRKADPPQLVPEVVYDAISTTRRPIAIRDRLRAARPSVVGAYDEYSSNVSDVTSLSPATTAPATAADLRGNYSDSKASRAVRDAILQANTGGRCLFCAAPAASTIDHYLPREAYPEFSVLPLNLVPACSPCNIKKGTTYAKAGVALFLHAYLDELGEGTVFLYADVAVLGADIAASFFVAPPPTIGEPIRSRIVSHFGHLALAEVYAAEATSEIGMRREAIATQLRGGGVQLARAYLQQEASSTAYRMGLNHWRAALLRAMAESDEVCSGAFLDPSGH